MWWHQFLAQWNGRQFFCVEELSSVDLSLYTDASSLGIGATCGNSWFSLPIPTRMSRFHINIMELFAVFVAVRVWGHQWANKRIKIFTDSSCVVQVTSVGTRAFGTRERLSAT